MYDGGRIGGRDEAEDLHANLTRVVAECDKEMNHPSCDLYGNLHDLKTPRRALL